MATDIITNRPEMPETLPLTVVQYRLLVEQGEFDHRHTDGQRGQIELINGRIVRMLPQGPIHCDPIDELNFWSHQVADDHFRVRIEKPIEIIELDSVPEPDIAWVTNRRYADRHPTPADIRLLIEVSNSSASFDRGEKLRLYAKAAIVEYWIVNVVTQTVEVFLQPSPTGFSQSRMHSIEETIAPQCLPSAALKISRLFSKVVE